MDLSQASANWKVWLLLACQGETNSAPHFSMPMALIASRHPELFEQRQIGRQQRLADVKARMVFLFKDRHLVTLLRQQRPDGGARRAAADHQDVALACNRGGRAFRQTLLGHVCPSLGVFRTCSNPVASFRALWERFRLQSAILVGGSWQSTMNFASSKRAVA